MNFIRVLKFSGTGIVSEACLVSEYISKFEWEIMKVASFNRGFLCDPIYLVKWKNNMEQQCTTSSNILNVQVQIQGPKRPPFSSH